MLALLRLFFAALVLWLMGASVHADVRVLIVGSDGTSAYAEGAQALIGNLTQHGVARSDIRQMAVSEWNAANGQVTALSPQAIIALGTEASMTLARARLKSPVLSALIPRSSFERVLRESGRKVSAQFNVLYLDQPLQRQLSLIRQALPEAKRVGVLLGTDSGPKSVVLRPIASTNGLVLKEGRIDANISFFSTLQSVLENSDVLLALADPTVYNSNSIQNILLSTIRYKVPMVAFSPAYVRAGAMLALYTTPMQAGAQSAQWALGVLDNRVLPELPMEPDDFEISFNEQVARVLGLSLDIKALTLALKRQEQLP